MSVKPLLTPFDEGSRYDNPIGYTCCAQTDLFKTALSYKLEKQIEHNLPALPVFPVCRILPFNHVFKSRGLLDVDAEIYTFLRQLYQKHWPSSFTDICVLFGGACFPWTNIHNRLSVFSFTSLPYQEIIGLMPSCTWVTLLFGLSVHHSVRPSVHLLASDKQCQLCFQTNHSPLNYISPDWRSQPLPCWGVI